MYFHAPLTLRQIVKNGEGGEAEPSAAFAFARMKPIETPRSPLDATMGVSQLHDTELPVGG